MVADKRGLEQQLEAVEGGLVAPVAGARVHGRLEPLVESRQVRVV